MVPIEELMRSAVPWWLVISLRHRFHLDTFVETGTAYGATALTASDLTIFQRVVTIEANPDIYANQHAALKASKAERLLGKTEEKLADVVASLTGPALFYLDAHWPGGGPKLGPECPLLKELAVLRPRQEAGAGDVIMIDDAGMFVHHPRPPHVAEEWPSVPQIVDTIAQNERHLNFIVIIGNVIVVSPEPIYYTI
jgi:hypothetical protein